MIHAVPGEPDFKDDPDRVKMETVEVFLRKEKLLTELSCVYQGIR